MKRSANLSGPVSDALLSAPTSANQVGRGELLAIVLRKSLAPPFAGVDGGNLSAYGHFGGTIQPRGGYMRLFTLLAVATVGIVGIGEAFGQCACVNPNGTISGRACYGGSARPANAPLPSCQNGPGGAAGGDEPCHPGPVRGAFQAGLWRKLQEDGNCWAGGPTSNLVNRMSDAGYYYCQQRSQRTASTPQQGLAMFERIRPPRNQQEASYDWYAVQLAASDLCPG
jgi:hypothetical protein